MRGPKKRQVDSECWVFSASDKRLYALFAKKPSQFSKKYNISHHYSTKHANYANNQSTQELVTTTKRLAANKQTQQNTFLWPATIQESNTKASYLLALKWCKLGWQRPANPSPGGEFFKRMHSRGGSSQPVSKEKMSLSLRTVTRRVELIDEDLARG